MRLPLRLFATELATTTVILSRAVSARSNDPATSPLDRHLVP
ncbi:hypothetical protein CLV68_5752 [Actinokineospora cianjurensis]|uniref:Uncharacterized protein n=1 Tax=Actinokineospora cianjurensis TaxID=585224 RepID=A0A421AY37_9PSEU|nr:hypothetical protein CLV68_5752 [Actinokineospora cianjurensis]